MTPPLVVLAPHLDDAALSAAGSILAWPGRRLVVTVFTGGAPARLPLRARRLHRRMGLGSGAAEARREEDRRACAVLGAQPVHLGLADAMYRGGGDVFAADAEDERTTVPAVRDALAPHVAGARVLAPRGTGGHRDHLIVRRAVAGLAAAAVTLYDDCPYAWRGDAGPAAPGRRVAVALDAAAWEAKLAALACYPSQLRMLWRGDWRGAVEREHAREGGVPVEHVWT